MKIDFSTIAIYSIPTVTLVFSIIVGAILANIFPKYALLFIILSFIIGLILFIWELIRISRRSLNMSMNDLTEDQKIQMAKFVANLFDEDPSMFDESNNKN